MRNDDPAFGPLAWALPVLQPDELVARWLRIVALFCHVRQGMCWSVQVLPSGSVQAIRALTVAIRSARAERTQANGQARP